MMKYDYFAEYTFFSKREEQQEKFQEEIVDLLACGNGRRDPTIDKFRDISDSFARVQLLAQTNANTQKKQEDNRKENKDGRAKKKVRECLPRLYKNIFSESFFAARKNLIKDLGLEPASPPSERIPSQSWPLCLTFKLKKNYLSKDDSDFYPVDNPVRKEWVFKVPYIAASQWKGNLRSVVIRELVADLQDGKLSEAQFFAKRQSLWRLFGNEKDGSGDFLNRALAIFRIETASSDESQYKEWSEGIGNEAKKIGEDFLHQLEGENLRNKDIDGYQGCLYFYPTYFNRIGLEAINPHSRLTGAGTHPIYLECVPKDTEGTFNLLYAPFGGTTPESRMTDFDTVTDGVWAMMTTHGFGAKTSSGYGLANILDPSTGKPFALLDGFKEFCRSQYPIDKEAGDSATFDEEQRNGSHT
ncbi:MAG: hypothetical protein BM485_13685 [Desulfobulbaceae bacterium DB1]|nr:MAG: hypothetical protein BM485_13685 [Desulfobulbaceae bacterium DB1]